MNPRIKALESYSLTKLQTEIPIKRVPKLKKRFEFVVKQIQNLCMPHICAVMFIGSRMGKTN